MKKKLSVKRIIMICILLIIAVPVCVIGYYLLPGSKIETIPDGVVKGDNEQSRSLIVYFSGDKVTDTSKGLDAVSSASMTVREQEPVGETTIAAQMIQEVTGADLYQIYTQRYYPSSYFGTAMKALFEEVTHARPEIANPLDNLDDYDIIYVGYPIWWMDAPMVIYTFFESHDLSGKTIIPFCTSVDSSIASGMEDIKNACKEAVVLQGITANHLSEQDIEEWLTQIGILGLDEKEGGNDEARRD